MSSGSETGRSKINIKCHLEAMIVLLLILGLLWGVSGVLLISDFKNGEKSVVWIGCIVGPFGVWIRWGLARLNGRGLGRTGSLNWIPFGTLIANVSACCVMAALATTKKLVSFPEYDSFSILPYLSDKNQNKFLQISSFL